MGPATDHARRVASAANTQKPFRVPTRSTGPSRFAGGEPVPSGSHSVFESTTRIVRAAKRGVERGVERARAGRRTGDLAPRNCPQVASAGVDIVDIWVNLVTEAGAEQFLGQAENAHIPGYLGSSGTSGIGTESMLTLMDEL